MGVAHAPLAALLGCDSGTDGRPAAQNAAVVAPPNLRAVKNMAVAYSVIGASAPLTAQRDRLVKRGTVLPNFGSPTLFPSSRIQTQATRGAKAAVREALPTGATADPG